MVTDPADVLRTRFGFDAFLPGQLEVVEHLLAGRSAAAVFPTGAGKSLCYQLPSLLLDGVTLVVSPLIALMKDQIDALARREIPAARLDSSLSAEEYRQVMGDLRAGHLRMLYVAPERFNNERFRDTFRQLDVALFAVDEAHCISEWGHNFRPDYLKLAAFAQECGAKRVLALTATATAKVLDDICDGFSIERRAAVRTGFYRPNLTLLTTPVTDAERDPALLTRLRERETGPTIVYVTLQKTAERVAATLSNAGFDAKPYHAGLKAEERSAIQDWFMASDRAVVVATIAFGMGVDKANIRYVYHYNLPKSLENYAQEIGRAGRDGEPSTCEVLMCLGDLGVLENFAHGDTPSRAAVSSFVRDIFSREESFDVSEYELSQAHDIRGLVLRTLMTYLEIDGYVGGGTPFYANYRFAPQDAELDEVLDRFEGERRQFLSDVFATATKARTWFSIDIDATAQRLSAPRDRIIRALDYLGDEGMLQVKVAGVRRRYQRHKSPEDLEAFTDELYERLLAREHGEIERLADVVRLASHDGCQVAEICAHFCHELDKPCGHCSWCLAGGKPPEIGERPTAPIDDALWQEAAELRLEKPNVLGEPRAFARFLCGVSSPRLSRARLGKHRAFGSQAAVPFAEVLAAAEALPPIGD